MAWKNVAFLASLMLKIHMAWLNEMELEQKTHHQNWGPWLPVVQLGLVLPRQVLGQEGEACWRCRAKVSSVAKSIPLLCFRNTEGEGHLKTK